MSVLLTDLHGIGLAMKGRYAPTSFTDAEKKEDHVSQLHVGYTTDPDKAEGAGKLGATVARCGGRVPAWEVTVRVIDP